MAWSRHRLWRIGREHNDWAGVLYLAAGEGLVLGLGSASLSCEATLGHAGQSDGTRSLSFARYRIWPLACGGRLSSRWGGVTGTSLTEGVVFCVL